MLRMFPPCWVITGALAQLATAAQLSMVVKPFASSCFFEECVPGVVLQFEWQVVQGGALDVDVVVKDPLDTIITEERRYQFGSYRLAPYLPGEYAFCLSNEHSDSQKLVYVELSPEYVNEADELDEFLHPGDSVLDFIETSLSAIRTNLKYLIDFQGHHRAQVTQHLYLARSMSTRVEVWGGIEALMVVLVAIAQVFVLRTWFQNPQQINRDAGVMMALLCVAIVVVNIPLIAAFFSGDNDLHEGLGHRLWEVVAGATLPASRGAPGHAPFSGFQIHKMAAKLQNGTVPDNEP